MAKKVVRPNEDEDYVEDDSPPVTIADASGEEGKMKTIVSLLKKFMGVKDLANLRLSLPASLIEPVPNLEYWTAGDRADMFAAIGDSEDSLERMLAVLRFSFTFQLKFVRGKVCKPYNSVLGEHFRCHWLLPPSTVDPDTKEPVINTCLHQPNVGDPSISGYNTPGEAAGSETSSIRSFSSKSMKSMKSQSRLDVSADNVSSVKVAFLCEQVSHHPPISSAYYSCPEKGVEAVAIDQISAKVSGMSVKIAPGVYNKGVFIRVKKTDEEYQVTNPTANVNGLLKGSYYGTISDNVTITCRGGSSTERYRTIIEYKDESWISKPRFALEGVVYKYATADAEKAESWNKIKDVPAAQVVGTLEGCWRKQITFKLKATKETRMLIDLDILAVIPKNVRPLTAQSEFESRRLWDSVTQKMLAKNYTDATTAKQAIEQDQRNRAAERKKEGIEFEPRFFEPNIDDGRPRLTEAGRKAIEAELAGEGY
ncbi:Oxysterol-binding protein [Phaffia rhodozyma]|uniref:Oxysterol-binding protein n=1 Tax=Phaffia rhodozyma TaxID=264483 RepID=A0A0F7SJ57_PHARH|nr:Oxysterol-binding protein [Phaffia rhodozyma]